jgi:hypothetical protein
MLLNRLDHAWCCGQFIVASRSVAARKARPVPMPEF